MPKTAFDLRDGPAVFPQGQGAANTDDLLGFWIVFERRSHEFVELVCPLGIAKHFVAVVPPLIPLGIACGIPVRDC